METPIDPLVIATVLLVVVTAILAGVTAVIAYFTIGLYRDGKDKGHAELRAYVSIVEAFRINTHNEHAPTFEVNIKNCGQTPAYELTGWGAIEVREFPFVGPIQARESHGVETKMTLGPDSEHTISRKRAPEWTEQEILDVSAGKAAIYWFGEINYKDAFGKSRATEFCFYTRRRADASTPELRRHTHGNNAT
jgi:hypothetical protein